MRVEVTDLLLDKLHGLGVIQKKRYLRAIGLPHRRSAAARRVVLVRLKLAETMREAVELVEQGHVRVGPEVVTDPAYLVTRGMEDYLTWVDTSKVRRHVLQYNDKLDDFDML